MKKNQSLACVIVMALAGQQYVVASELKTAKDFKATFRALVDIVLSNAQETGGRLTESAKGYLTTLSDNYFRDAQRFIKAAPFTAGSQSDKVTVLAALKKLMKQAIADLGDQNITTNAFVKKLTKIQDAALTHFNRQQTAIDKGIIFDANRERRELLRDMANDITVLTGRAKEARRSAM